jgi:hypothetical protein
MQVRCPWMLVPCPSPVPQQIPCVLCDTVNGATFGEIFPCQQCFIFAGCILLRLYEHIIGVGVRLAADGQSTSSSWYRASLWVPWPDIIFLIFSFGNYFVLVPRAPSLTRGRVCSLQCNHSLVRAVTPNNHTLPSHLNCVPFLSPLTTRRDCGGGILTRLHTGYKVTIATCLRIYSSGRKQ